MVQYHSWTLGEIATEAKQCHLHLSYSKSMIGPSVEFIFFKKVLEGIKSLRFTGVSNNLLPCYRQ